MREERREKRGSSTQVLKRSEECSGGRRREGARTSERSTLLAGGLATRVPAAASRSLAPAGPGLTTLVHFSAQLEPCLTQQSTLHTLSTLLHTLNTAHTTPYVHPLSNTTRSS
jgi:hypothetical protein